MRALVVVCALAGTAAADERTWHGSAGAGGSIVFTGARGDRFRLDAEVALTPRSRYGVLLAWRGFDEDHHGLVTAGVTYEGAAARPRLVLELHADVGIDLDNPAPIIGGGIRTTLTIVGPLAAVLDLSALLVIDGVDDTRLQLGGNALLAIRW